MVPSESPNDRATTVRGRDSSEAVARLYAEHAHGLRNFLVGLTGSEADAADCLHNCFVAFVQHGHRCAPAARRAWLYRVARNEAAALHRRRMAGNRALEQTAGSSMSEEIASPLMAAEQREVVRAAIARLTVEQRQIIELRIEQDLTFREIAERLRIPLGTALARMRAALKILGQELKDLDC